MTTKIWENSPYVENRAYHMAELTKFNEVMLEAGFIDYKNQNVTAIQNMPTSTWTNVADVHYRGLATLYYKMPVGDGSIKFEDVVGENYKNIVLESYDSTEVYIRLNFQMVTNLSGWADSNHIMPICRWNVSLTDSFLNANDVISKDRYASNIGPTKTLNYKYSIVHLDANSAFISYLDVRNSSSTSLVNRFTTHPLAFTIAIYRKDNQINVFYPRGDHINTKTLTSQNSVYLPTILHINKYGYNTITDSREMFQGGNDDFIPIQEDGKFYTLHTYINQRYNLEINPTILRMGTTFAPTYSIGFMDVLIKYKGEVIKGNYFIHGNISPHFRWCINAADTNTDHSRSSYLFLMNQHPCTTESVEE